MAVKKGTYKVDNGSGFDEIMIKTTADQVRLNSGASVEEVISKLGSNQNLDPVGFKYLENGGVIQWGQFEATLEGNGEVVIEGRYPTTFINFVGAKSINVRNSGLGSGTAYANNIRTKIIHKDNSCFAAVIKGENIPKTHATIEWFAIGY